MKTHSVSSTPSITSSSRPISTVSYLSEYEIVDTSTQAIKKPITNTAPFPTRQNASLFTSANEKPLLNFSNIIKSDSINEPYSSSINEIIKNGHSRLQSNTNNKNDQLRDLPTPASSNDGNIRFGKTSGAPTTPLSHTDDDWDDKTSRPVFLNPHFSKSIKRLPANDHIPE